MNYKHNYLPLKITTEYLLVTFSKEHVLDLIVLLIPNQDFNVMHTCKVLDMQ